MRTMLVVAVFLAAAGWLLLQNPASPPDGTLHERLRKRLGADAPPRTIAPSPPPPAPELTPPPPPALGERVAAEQLRREAMRPDDAAAVVSARRVDRWVVYAASSDRGTGPRLNPLVGQSAAVLDGAVLYAAHALRATAGAVWIVELESGAAPVAFAGGAAAPLVAAGAEPRACVLARSIGRCLVYAAAVKTDTLTLRFDFKEMQVFAFAPPSASNIAAGTLGEAPRPAAVQAAAAGATFASALPADLPESIAVLATPTVSQSVGALDVDGAAVPLLIRFGGNLQVAGRLTLTSIPGAPDAPAGFTLASLVPGNILPALGADGLAHSVPEVTP